MSYEAKCPIDGTRFEASAVASGTYFGRMLDFKPVGAVFDPPPLAICPKDGFIVGEYTRAERKKLKPWVESSEYRALLAESPYSRLASIYEFLGYDAGTIAWTYLRASWIASEDTPEDYPRYAESAFERFTTVLQTRTEWDETKIDLAFLCVELERRLGRFENAQRRATELADAVSDPDPYLLQLLDYQLELIGKSDNRPHHMPPHTVVED